MFHVLLDCCHKVRNQVVALFQLHIDPAEGVLDLVLLANQRVVEDGVENCQPQRAHADTD
jgi:hypothetical protein